MSKYYNVQRIVRKEGVRIQETEARIKSYLLFFHSDYWLLTSIFLNQVIGKLANFLNSILDTIYSILFFGLKVLVVYDKIFKI